MQVLEVAGRGSSLGDSIFNLRNYCCYYYYYFTPQRSQKQENKVQIYKRCTEGVQPRNIVENCKMHHHHLLLCGFIKRGPFAAYNTTTWILGEIEYHENSNLVQLIFALYWLYINGNLWWLPHPLIVHSIMQCQLSEPPIQEHRLNCSSFKTMVTVF